MARHSFSFDGGEKLSTMGASWFISYCWYEKVDATHLNWKKVPTFNSRKSVYNSTRKYHRYWLEQVDGMSELYLDKNKIGLSGNHVKQMAKKLLSIV